MARKLGFLAIEAVLVTILLLVPRVISDDSVPIPSDKAQVDTWFKSNVQPIGSRKDLDANITAAEVKSPKIITVNGAGGGDFKTLQAAFDSIPEQNKERVIVKLASGNYTEKVKLDYRKPYVTLYGDPKNPPNIIYNGNAAKYGTVDSATLILESDYFMGLNFNCINLSPKPDGSPGGQALALRSSGDWSSFYNVKGYGFQDTLCDDKGHHFWKDCYFEGTVDFIFGNAKSIYLNTEFKIIDNGKIANVVTAHARDNPQNDVGFSILHCKVTGAGKKSFLGRTWRSHPTVVYSYSDIGDIIDPWGWDNGMKPEFEKTAFFGEYYNKGDGADLAKRAGYTKKLTDAEVKPFLSLSYITASKWLLPPISL